MTNLEKRAVWLAIDRLIYPENYRTIEELRTGVFEYIEIFYNRQRRHSALGYDNPSHYELLSQRMNVSTICG